MKFIHCLVFILFSAACFANEIDKLQTNADVGNFLIKRISKKFKELPLLKTDAGTDTAAFSRNKFFKVDIDNNNLTDLVVYGFQQLVVILDAGSNNYEVRYLDGGAFQRNNANLISIDTIGSPKKIIIQQFERTADAYDTLVYLFNNFVEYNHNPDAAFSFESITFKTTPCYGECPVFRITINKDRSATYTAIRFNEQSGTYSGIVPKKDFDELLLLLQYLQFDKLKSNYAVPWTDSQTATTEISYSGKSKTITDYGEIGTYGLNLLYLRFFRFRTAVDWYDK